MAAGFAGDERLPLATDFGRIAFAYILFISLAALLSGVLNATGRFAAAAAAPLLLNIILIAALVLAETRRPGTGHRRSGRRKRSRASLPRHDSSTGACWSRASLNGARLDRRRAGGFRLTPACRG
jgi:hypothetical protein